MLLPTVTLAAAIVGGPPMTPAVPAAPAAPGVPAAPAAPAPPASPAAVAVPTLDPAPRARVAASAAAGVTERLATIETRVMGLGDDDRSDFTMTIADGRRTFVLTSRDGELSATVDGEPVPAERLREEDGAIVILGADGEEFRRFPILDVFRRNDGAFRAADMFRPDDAERLGRGVVGGATIDPPATMLGVHLESPGDVVAAQLGIDPVDATVVTGVLADLPADAGGLRPFDVIVAIDGTAPAPPEAVRGVLADAEPGDELELTVIRRGDRRDVTITLEAWDADRMSEATLRGRVAGGTGGAASVFGRLAPNAGVVERRDGNVFIAPRGEGDRDAVTLFRRPGRWDFEFPGGMGRVEIDEESAEELRTLAEELIEELEVELREELPGLARELRGEAAELEPMIRRQLREIAPMLREQVVELRPMVREQMREIGPVIAEIVALGRELEGLDPEEISGLVAERLEEAMRAAERAETGTEVEIEVEARDEAIGDDARSVRERERVERRVAEAEARARAARERAEMVEQRIAEARERARVARERAEQAEQAEGAAGRGDSGRLERLEDRMARIEAMLERLMDRLEREDPPSRD